MASKVLLESGTRQLLKIENEEGEVGYTVMGCDDTGNMFYFYFYDFTKATECFRGVTSIPEYSRPDWCL